MIKTSQTNLLLLHVLFFMGARIVAGQVVVSEVMYNPSGGNTNEFIELHNSGPAVADLSGWRFSAGITYTFPTPTTLAPNSYLVVAVNRAAFSLLYPAVTNLAPGAYSGQLSNDGETVTLSDAANQAVFTVAYDDVAPWPTAADGLGSSLVLVDAAASPNDPVSWSASVQLNGSPGEPDALFMRDVVINEVLAHTDPPFEDAVELRNLTTSSVSIAGWYLSDDSASRKKYRFPAGSAIPPLGYCVVYQYQLAGGPLPFSLSAKGEGLYLSEANAADQLVRYVDQYKYDASQNGASFGRHPDGTGDFATLAAPTFGVSDPADVDEFRTGAGARNAGPRIGPVVVNEIMYHPAETNAAGPMPSEYVELLNVSPYAVSLWNTDQPTNTWSLTGGVSYSFPTNVTLQPGQFLLVVETNDVAGFRASYGVPAGAQIFGPWSKSMGNGGDTVRLRAPNTVEADGSVGRYVVDEVTYDDQLPWPLAADGLGGSLERTDPYAYGGAAGNWHSAPDVATPGATNSVYVPPGAVIISEVMALNRSTLRDEDGDFSDWIELANTTDHAVSLKGWHLTDKADLPALWTFPDVSIPAHGQLLVFASSKDRAAPQANLHANFSLDAGGEYLALFRSDLTLECAFDPALPAQFQDISYGFDSAGSRSEKPIKAGTTGRYLVPTNAAQLAANWSARTFADGAWKPALNGLGYDTESTYVGLFQTDLRTEMYGSGKPCSAFVRYPFVVTDSASVAQILLRLKFEDGFAAWLNGTRVASNNVPSGLTWNSASSGTRSDSAAVVFQDYSLNAFAHLLVDGTNVLAMQVLNTSATSTDLLLMGELSLTWSASTGAAALASGYLVTPTPGSVNATALPGVTPAPSLSHPGGVFVGALSVTAACAYAQAVIRYTLDGSQPTTNSPAYSGPFTVTAETEIIVRAFAPGLAPSPVASAVFRRSFLGVNELMASNATATPEIADFTDFGDWVELYNGGTNALSVGGYFLSDSLDSPFRWRIPDGATIPARGHLLIWADGYDSKPGLTLTRDFWPNYTFVTRSYHANFKLSADGEQIGLFTPGGSLVDSVTFGVQQDDISLGRLPDGGAAWGYFGESTAGTTNRGPQLAQNLHRAPAVAISPTEPLFLAGPANVALSAPGPREIRYTLDGSQPRSSSLLFTNAFAVTTSTVVRARAFADGLHPGPVATRTFLVGQRKPELPVVSLVIDPLLLFDPIYGIYTNVLKERDVPGAIQFCTTPSNTAFRAGAAFRLFSLNTFLKAQKPFTVNFDSKYGDAEIAYQLFPEKPVGLFDRFVLRNGNDDWAVAFLRDTLGQGMLRGAINNAVQGFRPCASYLNGAYYGLINIQEKMDEVYCAKNYGVDLADIDFFENDGTSGEELLDYGTADAWNALLAFLGANSMAVAENYASVKSQVDIEDLVDYVAGQVFAADTAWEHNRKWWRDRKPGGKWRWCIVDLDRAFGSVTDNRLPTIASNMAVFNQLLNNPEFKSYCGQRLMAHLNSSFSTNRVLPIIDYEAGRIRSEIVEHAKLYGSKGGITSVTAWDANIEAIRSFARQRPALAMQHVASFFSGAQTAQLRVASGGAGTVLANHVPLLNGATNTLLAGVPVTFTAVPAIGQEFAYWLVSNSSTTLSDKGSDWRYKISTNDIPDWSTATFSDSAWAGGAGQLGYGDGDEATVIGASSNLIKSAYFRKAVVVSSAAAVSALDLQLLSDDGAIVYLNGAEILRYNMPTGSVAFSTFALTNITSSSTPDENDYLAFSVPHPPLVEGTNVLAVEIHQSSANYTDLGFDMQATAVRGGVVTNTAPSLTFSPDDASPLSVTAVFAPAGASLVPTNVAGSLTLSAAGSPWLATGDIYVPSNASLTAEPGVTILMPEQASIYVQGRLCLAGSPGAPVRIGPNTNLSAAARLYTDPALADATDRQGRWGAIAFDRADHPGVLSNVVMRGATLARNDCVNMKAAVSAFGSDLFMRGIDIDDADAPIFVQEGNSTVLEASRVFIDVIGDGINIKRACYARVEGCEFSSANLTVDTDAVDYDGIQGGIIRGNHIHDFMGDNNDAIDIGEGTLDLLVESNRIERCFDKGVSIGQGSTALVRRNVIRDVDLGLGVKDDGSLGLIEHNTFRDVTHAVSVYEKNLGAGGGSAVVRNCVVSHATLAPFACDALSSLAVAYTLCDTELYPGEGNLFAEPLFERPSAGNYRLQTGSAAVDAGDPASPTDPDSSRADMGALPFDWREGHVVISEIHYHPAGDGPEFVELTNPGGAPLDLSGFSFSKGVTHTFPAGTTLNPGAFLVVSSAAGLGGAQVWATGTLDNAGESLELVDALTNEVDSVAYEPTEPWPPAADGGGASLALIHPRWNNAQASSWYAGLAGGTPGAAALSAGGTPVWWLAQNGIGTPADYAVADAGDPDADGMPTWAEYQAGTSPTNSASAFLVDLLPAPGAPHVVCATVPAGPECGGRQRYYTVESRTNLQSGAWSPVPGYTDIVGAGQTIFYAPPPAACAFFRVRVELR